MTLQKLYNLLKRGGQASLPARSPQDGEQPATTLDLSQRFERDENMPAPKRCNAANDAAAKISGPQVGAHD
ncbi:hypothetical protein JEY40_31940 [Bradyrhizobium japonicum]|uniref:hypothetical protein n=1 Tax=Bradyrhizobium japonicum TaxID=375 RepID=UPI00200D0338|nr:hypothetical protein [Bradyrhizobium japonicum]UQD70534.1 hypothetical protein JEY40_31940 [Bradyrhizobium japonicum]